MVSNPALEKKMMLALAPKPVCTAVFHVFPAASVSKGTWIIHQFRGQCDENADKICHRLIMQVACILLPGCVQLLRALPADTGTPTLPPMSADLWAGLLVEEMGWKESWE